MVSISDPDMIEAVHGVRSKCNKGNFYETRSFMAVIMMRDRALHEKRRKAGWDEAFSPRCMHLSLELSPADLPALHEYESRLIKYAKLLEKSIEATVGQKINIMERMIWYR